MITSGYYDWVNAQQTCPKCGWVGLGGETATGEGFNEGSERHCPDCDHYFGFLAYPLLEESLTDPRAPESDRKFAKIAMRGIKNKDHNI